VLVLATGEGVVDSIWHTHGMIEKFVPSALPAMRASRQLNGELDFTAINRLHVPVALGSMLLLALLLILGMIEPTPAELTRVHPLIPANAGIQILSEQVPATTTDLGPRLRGDERQSGSEPTWSPSALALARLVSFAEVAPLAVTAALAILGNAVVCGVLANPHDRYGARMVWIATLVVAMVPWRLSGHRSSATSKARQAR